MILTTEDGRAKIWAGVVITGSLLAAVVSAMKERRAAKKKLDEEAQP